MVTALLTVVGVGTTPAIAEDSAKPAGSSAADEKAAEKKAEKAKKAAEKAKEKKAKESSASAEPSSPPTKKLLRTLPKQAVKKGKAGARAEATASPEPSDSVSPSASASPSPSASASPSMSVSPSPSVTIDPAEYPGLSASIDSTSVEDHQTVLLTLMLERSSMGHTVSGLGYTFTLPTDLVVAGEADSTCGGTHTAVEGEQTVSLADGEIMADTGACTIDVRIWSAKSGVYTWDDSAVSGITGGITNSVPSTTLTVTAAAPTLGARFDPNPITYQDAESTLTFDMVWTDENPDTSASGLDVTATLPTGVTVATTPSSANSCGGTLSAPSGGQTITYTGGTVDAATAQCEFNVQVTSTTPGTYSLGSGEVTFVGFAEYLGERCGAAQPGGSPSSEVCYPALEVTKLLQEISLEQGDVNLVDATSVDVTPTSDSGLLVDLASTTLDVCEVQLQASNGVNTFTVSLLKPGECTLQATQAGDSTYEPAEKTVSFMVHGTAQTITFGALADKPFSDGSVTVDATSDSQLMVTFSSATPDVCELADPTLETTGATFTFLKVGTCTIDADQAGDNTYDPADTVSQSFEITPAPQTITFDKPADVAITAGPVAISATVDSGMAVTFTVTTPTVCELEPVADGGGPTERTVALLAAGTCTIEATQPGDDDYAAAPKVTQSFVISLAAQTITFDAPADTKVDEGPVTVSATAGSGLPVTFSSSTTAVCELQPSMAAPASPSTGTVILKKLGTCTISADQAGNGTYAAAPKVTQSFQVTAGALPDPVSNVIATATETKITITWTAPTDTAGVTGYIATANPGPASCTTDSAATTTCFVGGEAGKTYTVSVVAINVSGSSTAVESNEVLALAPEPSETVPPNSIYELTTTDGNITTAAPGQDVTFYGFGFEPYSTVTISIHSAPRVLGTAIVTADGDFLKPVTIPPDLATGAHTAVAEGIDENGAARSMALAITVQASSTGTTSTSALAVTGPGVLMMILVGAGLTAAGATLVAGSRRRRSIFG
ncbi:hypothetical protein Val02_13750 [Virgisporangium aliadipatigenens]|uniref:Fibronectin type-III domain-containing protein n=1 Tax=Virgisporangium aliadipatigenens TaxID=741659 RepID=A0A8J3YFX8_9ACTN|nr:fibronectin type III domain-containing protein [Virgisporangium aliadipatigenens]GIJ44489.1 hypothetical protein Val02_13750 [Virgisporangium aliadipatigenens]